MALFPTQVKTAGGHAVREASPWIQRLARLGYAAKGVVYLVVGGIAVQAAVTPVEQSPQDSGGALRAILEQPFGRVMLAVVALGLAGYVLWRIVQALLDPENKGTDAKGIAVRAAFLISGLLHAALAVEAVRLVMGSAGGSGGGDQSAEHWTAVVMEQPLGRWIIGAVGVGIALFGLYQLNQAFRKDIRKRMDLQSLGGSARTQVERFGRFGLAARGVIFVMIGWFLVQSALQYDPEEAAGLQGALRALREQPYGPWLLGLVALGLMAYGVWQLVKARYRVIRPV